MIVVADTSPINYLILIDEIAVLDTLLFPNRDSSLRLFGARSSCRS